MAISELAALVPRFSMIVEDLTRLSNDDMAARSLKAFPKLALWLLRDARDPARLLDSFDAWSPAMLEIGRSRSGRDSLEVLITYMFRVINPMNQDELRAKLKELGPRTGKVAMTIAEHLHKQGLEQGIKQGIKKGRKEGRLDTLRSLLIFKFQAIGAADEARLKAATPEAIDRYFQRLLTAGSLAAVFEEVEPPQPGGSGKRTGSYSASNQSRRRS
jgi:hypothetical protein